MVYKDRWWVVTPAQEILLYEGRSPQCNPNKQIVERLVKNTEQLGIAGCTARQLPLVFIQIDLNDYVR